MLLLLKYINTINRLYKIFNAMTSFKTMRTTQIVVPALSLNPLNQDNHTISFSKFGKDYYDELKTTQLGKLNEEMKAKQNAENLRVGRSEFK